MAHTLRHSVIRPLEVRGSKPTPLPPLPDRGLSYPDPGGDPTIDFSTLVGPGQDLAQIIERWPALVDRAGLAPLRSPAIMPLSPAAVPYASGALRIAVVHHSPGTGLRLVRLLGAQLAREGFDDVLIEEGYLLDSAHVGRTARRSAGGGPWSVSWSRKHLDRIRQPPRVFLPEHVVGAASISRWKGLSRVALIDTGDEGAVTQTFFSEDDSDFEEPWDPAGHGTSVGSLIRLVAPKAEVHCYRVIEPGEEQAASSHLLSAVNEATMVHGSFKVVCIPLRTRVGVQGRREYKSLRRIVDHNRRNGQVMPVVVCAAGNVTKTVRLMSYPATEPYFLVALSLDWSGRVADYNCTAPPEIQVNPTYAYGGTKADPLGTRKCPGSGPQDLYGSSFAAALAAGALLSQT